jgi:hypothetical protein
MKTNIDHAPKIHTPKPITLQQIQDNPIVARKGKPATLNQIAWWSFSKRSDEALEAAKAGDFAPIDALLVEIKVLLDNFLDHGRYLQIEEAIIKDPDGPEARERADFIALAKRDIEAKE